MRQNDVIKYLVLGSAAVLFLGLTVWLIRNEGRQTRDSIREGAKDIGSDVHKGIVEGAERAVDKAAEVPGKIVHDVVKEAAGEGGHAAKEVVGEAGKVSHEILGDVKDILRGPEKPEAKIPTPVPPEKPSSSPPPPAEKADGTRSVPATLEQKPAATARGGEVETPSPPAPTPPANPIKQIFDLGHKVSRTVDDMGQEVLALSWNEEQQVGRQVHATLAREHAFLRPPEVMERLQRLIGPIVQQRTRKELVFTLEVVQDDEVNAFAHIGGYIYVNTGCLNFAKPDAELQFILAHEIGHQELKHVLKKMTYAARASQVGGEAAGTLAQAAYLAIALGYSKDQEEEADAWAYRAMRRAGRSRDEALSGMRHLLAYFTSKGLEPKQGQSGGPVDETLRQIRDHFFKSHPPTAERLQRLEAIQP